MPAFGDVSEFKISPNSQTIVYVADQQTDEVFELFAFYWSKLYLPLLLRGI